MWNVEKVVSKGKYNYAVVKNHPRATKHGYVLEHRIVMENHLGRLLGTNEVVHHKNRNGKDNRIENLELMTGKKHKRLHAMVGRSMVRLKCPWCKKVLTREQRNTHLVKGSTYTSCSTHCNGKFSRYIQLHGRTIEVEQAISENVIEVFIATNILNL